MADASASFPVTERTRMQRRPKRATYERETVHAILDEALIASVAVCIDGEPHVQPMIHVRDGEQLILHGNANNRLLAHVAAGAEVCINVALIDALVLARRINDHTMHYRSATVYGRGELIENYGKKKRLMDRVFNHLVKTERLEHLPPLPDGYLDGTMVVLVPIKEAVGKVNSGIATDDGPDGIWSGLIPIQVQKLDPRPDERTRSESAQLGAPAR